MVGLLSVQKVEILFQETFIHVSMITNKAVSDQKVEAVESNRHELNLGSPSLAVCLWACQLTSLCLSCFLQTKKSW